jgi:hypothetical protein
MKATLPITMFNEFLIIFPRALAAAMAVAIAGALFLQLRPVASLGAPQDEKPAAAVGFTWYCDNAALLYPDGPRSTPICVAYTPARKL